MLYRHELKYLIHQSDYHILRMRMAAFLDPDPHADSEGLYTIRSLYFDDYFNRAYNEKEISILDREKYRIRIYNFSEKPINLERKIKHNNYVRKEVAPFSAPQVYAILRGDYSFLKESKLRLHKLLHYELTSRLLRPRVLIDYEREPFVYEGGTVRINFDKNVRAGFNSTHFFVDDVPMTETLQTDFLIMEVKYSEFLPSIIREMLTTKAVNYTSMSKYILGCDRTLVKRQTDN